MRSIIKLKFYDIESAEESAIKLENFLRLEGYSVINFEDDKFWIDNNRIIKDKINSFLGSLAKHENNGLKIRSYIFSSNGVDGLLSYREGSGLRVILYKHNLARLQNVTQDMVNSIVSHFNRFTRASFFSVTRYVKNVNIDNIEIRENSNHNNLMVGQVLTTRRSKRHMLHKIKAFEYRAGLILLFFIIFSVGLSFVTNIQHNFKVDELNNGTEYTVEFFERLIGPLMVTSSLLWFNFFSYKSRFMKNNIVIEWK
jgi:hypothetical protein